MRAVVFDRAGLVVVDEIDDPVLSAPTDAVVGVVAAGVCGSDLWYFRGIDPVERGAPLGHEFVGVVRQVGTQVENFRVGDAVVAPFNYADGTCAACRRGLPSSCPAGGFWGGAPGRGGAQAEAITVPFADANLVRVPAPSDDKELFRYLLAADVLPTACHAVANGEITGDSSVAIVGDGPVALATVLMASRAGAGAITVVGHHADRLAVASSFGATHVLLAEGDAVSAGEQTRRLAGEITTVIECVGTQAALDTALACVRDGGLLSWVGLPVGDSVISMINVFDRNLTLRGGVTPARHYLPGIIDSMSSELDRLASLVDFSFRLDDAQAAYEAMDRRRVIKSALIP
ncbi:alcohol dehydrogenase catalytic domain-containing protein [Microbispora sp. CA-135349]|uniref:alcohol dehydrogenase catalytic domain-containing protein n=1 Tax=Microbispora sp. CA-135349 TaxID=3239953 RepID=UPI003D93696F